MPGGRIDTDEFGNIPFHDVLERELLEEIGIPEVKGNLIGVSQWERSLRPGESGDEEVLIFVVHYDVDAPDSFEPVLSEEHQAALWVADPDSFLVKGLIPEK